jgi:prolipoprotein diacylglyceryltransferase
MNVTINTVVCQLARFILTIPLLNSDLLLQLKKKTHHTTILVIFVPSECTNIHQEGYHDHLYLVVYSIIEIIASFMNHHSTTLKGQSLSLQINVWKIILQSCLIICLYIHHVKIHLLVSCCFLHSC